MAGRVDLIKSVAEKRLKQHRKHGSKFSPELPNREQSAEKMTPDVIAALTAELDDAGIARTEERAALVSTEASIAARAVAGPRVGPFLLKWQNEIESAKIRILLKLKSGHDPRGA